MNESYEFSSVDKLTIGTRGEPGSRLFVLQATDGTTTVTVKIEKEQTRALAQYLGNLLQDVPRPGHLPEGDELALTDFVEPAWPVGSIGLTYDNDLDRIILLCDEAIFNEDEDEADLDSVAASLRVAATREQIAALAILATQLVEAGRPPCPLCGFPLNPEGHACPKTNGHRPPSF